MALPNAVAGPSHVGSSSTSQLGPSSLAATVAGSSMLEAYLPPDPAPPRSRSIIHPTHDLLGRYGILPVYDEFVRPFTTAPTFIEDKGKRKEDAASSAVPTVQDGTDDTRSGPKEGLFQHGYKHFIKDLGLGKHNHKKDTFLTDLMLFPEKQAVPIVKLDRTTLVHAFRLKEGGVPGFNSSALTGDDEKRKKKKKKRPIDPTQTSAPGSQLHTPAPPAANPSTPRSSTPAPIRRPPPPPSQLANGHVPPQSSQPPQPTQRPPPQPQRHPLPANPKAASAAARPPGAGTGVTGTGSIKRKDREDTGVNGHVTANGSGGGGGGGMGSGANGLKPAKKRKMDPMAMAFAAPPHHQHQHQVVQQPTPHY